MDKLISFKAALLQARNAELKVRGGSLKDSADVEALARFETELQGALDSLRAAGAIPADPLADVLSQCATVLLWERRTAAESAYFAELLEKAFAELDRLIVQGLPDADWNRFREAVAALESDLTRACETSRQSRPANLWQVVSDSDVTNEVLADLLRHAGEGALLTVSKGWKGPSVDLQADSLGLPEGWQDHFNAGDDAQARIATRPGYEAGELARLNAEIAVAEERKEIWQKYQPRIEATGLPFNAQRAYELIVQDPGAVVGQLTEFWPETDRRLSARVMGMFESGNLGLAEGVALLATDKDALKAQTAAEIRSRIEALPGRPLFAPEDFHWICNTPDKVKTVYTAKLETACSGYTWKHGFSISTEDEETFAQGTDVAEGLATLLEGKSKKHDFSEDEIATVFNQLRRVPEIAEDLHSIDCSKLTDSADLPDGWADEYWRTASFEIGDWVVANPLHAVRLLTSEIPRIVEEYTGRRQLAEWRDAAQPLLDDPDVTTAHKAMLLPAVLGLSGEIPFILEKFEPAKEEDGGVRRLVSLKEEAERPFPRAEVNALLSSAFPEKLSRYCGQTWLEETLQSRAAKRSRFAQFGMKAVAGVAVVVIAILAVLFFVNSARNRAALSEQEREAALKRMILEVEADFSALPIPLEKGGYKIELDGNALVDEGLDVDGQVIKLRADLSKLEPGNHVFVIDHPNYKLFQKDIAVEFGNGASLGLVKLEPATGSLELDSDPSGANVTLNGEAVGQTPLKLPGLAVGTNAIALSSGEFGAFQTNAVIVRDKTLAVLHRFASGVARLVTTPPGFHGAIERVSDSNPVIRFKPEWTATPIEQTLSPGDYMFALVHPTLGDLPTTRFQITDKQTNVLAHQFPAAKPPVTGLPAGAKYWRGTLSLNGWMDWNADWQFSTKNEMTLFRLWNPGFLPQVYPLHYREGSFRSPLKSAMRTGGTVECWGSDTKGQCTVPDEFKTRKFIDIAAGANHTVGLTEDLKVVAWGDNSLGQCNVPADLGPCMMVAAGANHTMILRTDGKVMAWGDNRAGQALVPDDLGYCAAISAAGNRSGALNLDGSIEGWGYGRFTVPPRAQWRPFVDLSMGLYFISALDDLGQPAIYIQTTTGAGAPTNEVAQAAAKGPLIATAAGKTYTMWINHAGKLSGIGRDPTANRLPDSAGPFLSVAVGDSRNAALCADGNIVIWGSKAGVSERNGFERQTEESNRLGYWRMKGSFLKVVTGDFHYVALKQ